MALTAEKERLELKYLCDPDGRVEAAITVEHDPGALPQRSDFYSPSLAREAAALSFSAMQAELLSDNLERLGYSEIGLGDLENTRADRIGLCIARGRSGERERIAIVLRGTKGQEWYSNFEPGYAAEHVGFTKAADYAENRLTDYLLRHGIDEPELFITGYSRGGAVANLLAKRMCDRYGTDAVRAYTFAAPNTAVTLRAEHYGCIFNLVREEDFFARVPLTGWGYTKYGRILFLSGDVSEAYLAATGEDYIGLTDSTAADEALGQALKLAPSVHAYYERRYPVGGRQLSLYGYMNLLADMLAGHTDEHFGVMMIAAAASAFGELAAFLSRGADLTSVLVPTGGVPRSSLADSHSPAAYAACLVKNEG